VVAFGGTVAFVCIFCFLILVFGRRIGRNRTDGTNGNDGSNEDEIRSGA
jgi:hypothetical protein